MEVELSEGIRARLDILTEVAHILQLERLTSISFASSTTQLSHAGLELKTTLNRLEHAEKELEYILASTRYQEQLITK